MTVVKDPIGFLLVFQQYVYVEILRHSTENLKWRMCYLLSRFDDEAINGVQ